MAEGEGFVPSAARAARCLTPAPASQPSVARLAEGEGFEPPEPFPVQWFSRPPPSTTRPSLRVENLAGIRAISACAPTFRPSCHRKCNAQEDTRHDGTTNSHCGRRRSRAQLFQQIPSAAPGISIYHDAATPNPQGWGPRRWRRLHPESRPADVRRRDLREAIGHAAGLKEPDDTEPQRHAGDGRIGAAGVEEPDDAQPQRHS